MIVGIEGLSTSGKTTFINKFLEKYPNAIRFRGAGAVNVGMQGRWQEYNFWMHNIIEQLDKLNNHKNIILWDRFLTDAVHSEDPIYRSEILRVMKSHQKKCVIYVNVPEQVLIQRGTKEGSELNAHKGRYENVIKSFNTLILEPGKEHNKDWIEAVKKDTEENFLNSLSKDAYFIKDSHVNEAYNFIKQQAPEIVW